MSIIGTPEIRDGPVVRRKRRNKNVHPTRNCTIVHTISRSIVVSMQFSVSLKSIENEAIPFMDTFPGWGFYHDGAQAIYGMMDLNITGPLVDKLDDIPFYKEAASVQFHKPFVKTGHMLIYETTEIKGLFAELARNVTSPDVILIKYSDLPNHSKSRFTLSTQQPKSTQDCQPNLKLGRTNSSHVLMPEKLRGPVIVKISDEALFSDEKVHRNAKIAKPIHGQETNFPGTYETNLCLPEPQNHAITRDSRNQIATSLSGSENRQIVQTRPASRNQSATNAHPKTTARYPSQARSDERLRSYITKNWPRQLPKAQTLVEAGFFYTGSDDFVKCYQCGIGLKDFSDYDDPLKEHVRHSEKCLFLLEYFKGEQGLQDYKLRIRDPDPDEHRRQQLQRLRENRHALSSAPIRHPEYKYLETRLKSFEKWPPHLAQRPGTLAEAGFFYSGAGDQVRCFSCDGGLKHWDEEDDPWTEHCRWFPACTYAVQVKGVDFIELVQQSVDSRQNNNDDEENDNTSAMGAFSIEDTAVHNQLIEEHKHTFVVELGFNEDVFQSAIQELKQQRNFTPSVDDIFVVIDVLERRKHQQQQQQQQRQQQQNRRDQGSPTLELLEEENRRLSKMLTCIQCKTSTCNCLFLPCTHHKMCIECANSLFDCPLCGATIKDKIRTYMA